MFLLLSLLCLSKVNSLNILIFSPTFATSHMTFQSSIADTLTDAGHNVTILAPVIDERLRSHALAVKTKDVLFIEKDEIMKNELSKAADPVKAVKSLWESADNPADIGKNFKWMLDQLFATTRNIMRNEEIFELLKARHFDIGISESMTICGLALFRKVGIEKTILAFSIAYPDAQLHLIGEPNHLAYVPTSNVNYNDKMSLLERYNNYQSSEIMKTWIDQIIKTECEILSKWEISNCQDLLSSSSAVFVNSNPYIDFPRPVIQKTVPIGGINIDVEKIKGKKLSEEWDQVLNLRPKNMLLSFGSIAKSMDMPNEWRNNILKVIRSLPEVTFIWKYESDDTQWAQGVENVKFVKWTPQSALLADKRVTAFLTHGGLGSTNELAHLGKPALTVPIFGDQMRNAHMLARHNGSVYFDKFSLSNFKLLKESINKILFDESYRKNAERLADILRDQPSPPKQTVVKQVEFIGKYGPFPNMDPYGRKLSKIQLEMIDVFVLIHLPYALIIVFLVIVLKYVCTYFSRYCKNELNEKLD